jgi:hypothetical protein
MGDACHAVKGRNKSQERQGDRDSETSEDGDLNPSFYFKLLVYSMIEHLPSQLYNINKTRRTSNRKKERVGISKLRASSEFSHFLPS